MKVAINIYDLKNTLSIMEKGITANRYNSTSGMLFFSIDTKNKLTISAQDNLFITTSFKIDSAFQEGNFCLEGKTFIDFIKKCENDIELDITDNQVKLTCGKVKSTFIKSSTQFPTNTNIVELFANKDNAIFSIIAEDFISSTNTALVCTAKENTRPLLQGLNFKYKSPNNELIVCGIDGYRLAKKTINIETENNKDINFTILNKAITIINNIISITKAEKIKVVIENQKIAYFIINDTFAKVPLLAGEFINYERIIPNNESQITLDRQELKKSVELIQLVSKTKNANTLFMTYNNNAMKFYAKNEISDCEAEIEKAKDSYCSGLQDGFQVGCNAQYLLEAIKNITANNIKLTLGKTNAQPLTIESEDTYCMILPVRVMS